MMSLATFIGRWLYPGVTSKDSYVRYRTVEKLGSRTGSIPMRLLLDRLQNDPDKQVRGRAAQSLGAYKHPLVVKALIEAVRDGDCWYTARSAAKALGNIGDSSARDILLQ